MNPYQQYNSGMDTSIPMQGYIPRQQDPMSTLASIYRMKRMMNDINGGGGYGGGEDNDPLNRLGGLRRLAAMHILSNGGGDDSTLGVLHRFTTLHNLMNGGGNWFGE